MCILQQTYRYNVFFIEYLCVCVCVYYIDYINIYYIDYIDIYYIDNIDISYIDIYII